MGDIKTTYYFSIFTFVMAYVLILLAAYLVRRKKQNIKYSFGFIAVFILYMLMLVNTTFFPIIVAADNAGYDIWNTCIQLNPLQTISGYFEGTTTEVQITGNILLLMPMAVFIGTMQKQDNAGKCIARNFFYCVTISVMIELSQLMINLMTQFPNRVVDIDDIILNSAGALLGAVMIIAFKQTSIYKKRVAKLIHK